MISCTPPVPPPDEDLIRIQKYCFCVGFLIAETFFQIILSFWWNWVIFNIMGRQINQLLWILGMTILFSGLYIKSEKIFLSVTNKVALLLILATIFIWITK